MHSVECFDECERVNIKLVNNILEISREISSIEDLNVCLKNKMFIFKSFSSIGSWNINENVFKNIQYFIVFYYF